MPSSVRARVAPRGRVSRGYAVVDVAVASVVSLVLAAAFAPRIHELRQHGMDTGVAARLQLLRGAVWTFRMDHNEAFPTPGRVEEQLLSWTDTSGGDTSRDRSGVHFLSPYLRQIPALTVGSRAGARKIGAADAPGVGWSYADGLVRANTLADERDARGVAFLDY